MSGFGQTLPPAVLYQCNSTVGLVLSHAAVRGKSRTRVQMRRNSGVRHEGQSTGRSESGPMFHKKQKKKIKKKCRAWWGTQLTH